MTPALALALVVTWGKSRGQLVSLIRMYLIWPETVTTRLPAVSSERLLRGTVWTIECPTRTIAEGLKDIDLNLAVVPSLDIHGVNVLARHLSPWQRSALNFLVRDVASYAILTKRT